MLTSRIKSGLAIAILLVWAFLYFFVGEPAPKPYWLSKEAKEFVISSMNDFCKGLYSDGVCPDTRLGGKQRWIMTSVFGTSGVRTEQVDQILSTLGWVPMELNHDGIVGFCKHGYFARYEYSGDFVSTISFHGGSHGCEKMKLSGAAAK
jgi:hypothetical protein